MVVVCLSTSAILSGPWDWGLSQKIIKGAWSVRQARAMYVPIPYSPTYLCLEPRPSRTPLFSSFSRHQYFSLSSLDSGI